MTLATTPCKDSCIEELMMPAGESIQETSSLNNLLTTKVKKQDRDLKHQTLEEEQGIALMMTSEATKVLMAWDKLTQQTNAANEKEKEL